MIHQRGSHAGPHRCADVVENLGRDGSQQEPAHGTVAARRQHHEIGALLLGQPSMTPPGSPNSAMASSLLARKKLAGKLPQPILFDGVRFGLQFRIGDQQFALRDQRPAAHRRAAP